MRNAARKIQRQSGLRKAFADVDPEPIIAVLEGLAREERRQRLQEVIASRLRSVTVLMDAPHDPHNGAAVMRSCDAFGVYTVHVVERTERFSASNAVAKGAERWVDVVAHTTVSQAVASIGSQYHLVGTHPQGRLMPRDLTGIPRIALVMGNEHDGISRELEEACDDHVRVPMRGFVESLNVSVSAAILLAYATDSRAGDLSELEKRRLYARGLVLTVPRSLVILEAKGLTLPALAAEATTQ
jgi:tRNA (guanosine-2'-O-)-methyltransferase